MVVLSLFDGIASGHVALERAGIHVGKYYASEVKTYAIKCAKANNPDIIHVGRIENWKDWIDTIDTPDLILGGSPCQGFSIAGAREAFDDRNSILFYTFADIVKYVQVKNPKVKFLMENVQMHNVYVGVISYILGVKPILINSALVSAQERKRLYWCNWHVANQPIDKQVMLRDVLDKERNWYTLKPWMKEGGDGKSKSRYERLRNVASDKAFCITAHKTHPQNHYLSEDGTRMTYLTVAEIEKLQTLPEGYCNMLSEAEAFDVVGNGWTVDVIVHLLSSVSLDS